MSLSCQELVLNLSNNPIKGLLRQPELVGNARGAQRTAQHDAEEEGRVVLRGEGQMVLSLNHDQLLHQLPHVLDNLTKRVG